MQKKRHCTVFAPNPSIRSITERAAHIVFLLFWIWAGVNSAGRAQDSSRDSKHSALHEELDAIRKKHHLPGLIAGHFTVDGKLQLEVCGSRKHGGHQELQLGDAMHLGSCTKSMTATLAAILVDEGKLKWETTLGEVFADEPAVKNSPWADATVDQLLTHQSGAIANPPWDNFSSTDKSPRDHRRALLRWLIEQPRLPSRIGKFEYSNLGYAIAGHMIETIRGQSWEEEMRERLFKPLGMETAGFGPPTTESDEKGAFGHVSIAGVVVAKSTDNPPALGPAGTVHASMEDWCKFLRVHLLQDPSASGRLPVCESTWKHLHQPVGDSKYACGWIVDERDWAQRRIFMHNGSNTMWYCVVFLAPDQGRGVFAASNIGLPARNGCDEALQLFIRHNPYKAAGK